MDVSETGLLLIAEFEGFAPYLYNDPAGHATVGYGYLVHLGRYHEDRGICAGCDKWARKSERHLWMSAAQGRALLRETARPYADTVRRWTFVPLTQNQFDALTSFCYNVGQGGYIGGGVRLAVNARGDVCGQLRRIVFGVGWPVPLPGLVRRRDAECALFYSNAPSIPAAEGDDDMERFNDTSPTFMKAGGVPYSTGKYAFAFTHDFAKMNGRIPRAIEVDLAIEGTGSIIVRDGSGAYAADLSPNRKRDHFVVYPGPQGQVPFEVSGDIRIILLGALRASW